MTTCFLSLLRIIVVGLCLASSCIDDPPLVMNISLPIIITNNYYCFLNPKPYTLNPKSYTLYTLKYIFRSEKHILWIYTFWITKPIIYLYLQNIFLDPEIHYKMHNIYLHLRFAHSEIYFQMRRCNIVINNQWPIHFQQGPHTHERKKNESGAKEEVQLR